MNYAINNHPHMNTAEAQIQALYASKCEEAPPSLTGDVSRRLETLGMIIGDASSDLTSLSDRLFGAGPRPAPGSSGAQNKPAGQAGELVAILDGLIERAAYARDEARSLNSRI